MSEQTQSAEVRRRRSRAEVARLVAEYEGSGLGRVEFCRTRGLSLSTLARYRKRRSQADAGGGSRWVAVEVSSQRGMPGAYSGLAVALAGGRHIEVGCGFDAPTLRQLLTVLEQG